MANIDLKKLQGIELEIFKEFVRLCEKHNLTYSLAFGTAIGAIRHKGFIPWDDDIDIIMPRKDYEYFIKVAVKDMNTSYFLQNYHSEPNCGLIFSKIRKNGTILSENYSYHLDMHQGVWLDIFPVDNVSDDYNQYQKDLKKILTLKGLYIIKCGYKLPEDKNTLMNKVLYCFAKCGLIFFSKEFFINLLDKEMQKYNQKETKNVYICGGANDKFLLLNSLLKQTIDVFFEGLKVKITKEYDYYLTHHYGKYMELPPVEKRINGSAHFIHEFKEKI